MAILKNASILKLCAMDLHNPNPNVIHLTLRFLQFYCKCHNSPTTLMHCLKMQFIV